MQVMFGCIDSMHLRHPASVAAVLHGLQNLLLGLLYAVLATNHFDGLTFRLVSRHIDLAARLLADCVDLRTTSTNDEAIGAWVW